MLIEILKKTLPEIALIGGERSGIRGVRWVGFHTLLYTLLYCKGLGFPLKAKKLDGSAAVFCPKLVAEFVRW
jgi:hypothetical protein